MKLKKLKTLLETRTYWLGSRGPDLHWNILGFLKACVLAWMEGRQVSIRVFSDESIAACIQPGFEAWDLGPRRSRPKPAALRLAGQR